MSDRNETSHRLSGAWASGAPGRPRRPPSSGAGAGMGGSPAHSGWRASGGSGAPCCSASARQAGAGRRPPRHPPPPAPPAARAFCWRRRTYAAMHSAAARQPHQRRAGGQGQPPVARGQLLAPRVLLQPAARCWKALPKAVSKGSPAPTRVQQLAHSAGPWRASSQRDEGRALRVGDLHVRGHVGPAVGEVLEVEHPLLRHRAEEGGVVRHREALAGEVLREALLEPARPRAAELPQRHVRQLVPQRGRRPPRA